jgi:hypothetical protein
MKSNKEDLSTMIIDENSMNFQSKIQKFVNSKTIIKPPIPKREFLDNMNIALCDINLEQEENFLSIPNFDEKICSSVYSKEQKVYSFIPDPLSRISSFQL